MRTISVAGWVVAAGVSPAAGVGTEVEVGRGVGVGGMGMGVLVGFTSAWTMITGVGVGSVEDGVAVRNPPPGTSTSQAVSNSNDTARSTQSFNLMLNRTPFP